MFDLFNSIQNSNIGLFLGKQNHLLGAAAGVFHVIGLILVLASILIVGLRLLGIGIVSQSLPQLVKSTSKFIWIGLAFLVISGLILFVPAANIYYPNDIFWFKFQTLLAALIVHFSLYKFVTKSANPNPILAFVTGVLSIGLWFTVAFAGRFVGFF